ncbi:MAG: MOSC domain-containing protein [Saprospiraceae bacterium]
MQLSEIYIYPIKALGGIQLITTKLTTRGLANDRRFMLVDSEGIFMTQRTIRKMALLSTAIKGNQLIIWHKDQPGNSLAIPINPTYFTKTIEVDVWGISSIAQVMPTAINQWFQAQLKTDCQLVYMPDTAERRMKETYNTTRDLVSFADGAPILIAGQAGLDDLNNRLEAPVSMNRFRPNLVFTGGAPFSEDEWTKVKIGDQSFKITHRCVRCNVPNINQETAKIVKEPNRTLATFRRFDNKIYFGVNTVWEEELAGGNGEIKVGDMVTES